MHILSNMISCGLEFRKFHYQLSDGVNAYHEPIIKQSNQYSKNNVNDYMTCLATSTLDDCYEYIDYYMSSWCNIDYEYDRSARTRTPSCHGHLVFMANGPTINVESVISNFWLRLLSPAATATVGLSQYIAIGHRYAVCAETSHLCWDSERCSALSSLGCLDPPPPQSVWTHTNTLNYEGAAIILSNAFWRSLSIISQVGLSTILWPKLQYLMRCKTRWEYWIQIVFQRNRDLWYCYCP